MTFLDVLSVFNYGLVLIYGLFLSAAISGGWQTRRQRQFIIALIPVFLLIQSVCYLILGVETVKRLYPLIVHLPLILALIFVLKKPVWKSVISTCTAYLCCQLPRCVDLLVTAVTRSSLAGEISYTVVIVPIYLLLKRYFAGAAHSAMTCSPTAPILFGSLPVTYYIFDYATTIYSDILYSGVHALAEFLPTALIIFYVAFLTAYHAQIQDRAQAEMQRSMLESELEQSQAEIDALRLAERQTTVYRHDMRHHLNMIEGLLSTGRPQEAAEYIQKVKADIEAITPRRFCENALVNLLCSSFCGKAEEQGVRLTVDAKLPPELPISDTELCSVLSNSLENALRAAAALPPEQRTVDLYCGVRLNKLLIEVRNPYAGEVLMQNGLPVSDRAGHGYGCRSIEAIARHHGGLCEFRAEGGIFQLRLAIPVSGAPPMT